MDRNARLATIMDWASENDIDLDNAEITPKYGRVTFYHRNESAYNMRNVKRAVGKFETVGQAPYISLEKRIQYDGQTLVITYSGAFECNITHDCKPATFEDGSTVLEV